MTDTHSADAHDRMQQYPDWPSEALEALAQSQTATARKWTLALDVVTSSEQTWLTSSEIAQAIGVTRDEWKNAPAQLGRMLNARETDLPTTTVDWPGLVSTDAWPLVAYGFDSEIDELSWAVTGGTRARWNAIRGVGSCAAV